MANLKEVRDRIKSVKNTQQITKAMKMVSAAKLRRAQDAIISLRPYADRLNVMLSNILSNLEGDAQTSLGEEREIKRACLVVVTSNRGLCGAFNTNVSKSALEAMETKFADVKAQGNLDVLCIGKKGYEYLRRRVSGVNFNTDYMDLFNDLSFDNVAKVPRMLIKAFEEGRYDAVSVAYGKFKNAGTQYTITDQFLPVPKIEKDENDNTVADYIFEPDQTSLLEYLVPTILQTQFQKYLLDTHASEHGARMTAMDKASENANELLRDLKIMYNKARQEAITNEILEIVGGAAALENG
ncbi:MAG: ATP synthase F1 subunit gamma [Chitinophagales bacterium]|nr:ATP synthase F1 subunit gamma [Chitinophagales bacterium]